MPLEHLHTRIAPSILAADFARLGQQVAEAEQAGADRIHIDVMDGHFVRNISVGPPIVACLRPVTQLPLEAHLMISDPDSFLQQFADSGTDSFLVHWEANPNLHRTVGKIRALGRRAGVVVNPATPASILEEIVPEVQQVLVMTVNPGCDLAVDGGIGPDTARLAVEAGANVLVAGTAIFGTRDGVAAGVKGLRAAVSR